MLRSQDGADLAMFANHLWEGVHHSICQGKKAPGGYMQYLLQGHLSAWIAGINHRQYPCPGEKRGMVGRRVRQENAAARRHLPNTGRLGD